jgi:hypothetical protein
MCWVWVLFYIIDCTIVYYYIMYLWYSTLYNLVDYYMYVFDTIILYEIMWKVTFEYAVTCLCEKFRIFQ